MDMRQNIADILREYANALRDDWGSIDGRSERITLDAFADHLENNKYADMEALRFIGGLCTNGYGHWSQHCEEEYCGAVPD